MTQTLSSEAPGQKEAQKWFKHGDWRKGLVEKPHSSINAVELSVQYHKHKEWWDKAFAFLNRKDLATMAPGNYPIVGDDVFASVSDYKTKDFDKSQWESHRKYADIQCMVKGEEKIGKAPLSALTVTMPYDADKDIAHYSGPGKYYIAKPGTFFIFFPEDAHRPNITAKDTGLVRKVVIKMRVSE
jgi:YhcH/YjgK/YiaL family protein